MGVCQKYNKDEFSPIDGRIIRGCDHLAACVETYTSHTSGVSTHILRDANNGMCANYKNSFINGIDFGCLFDYFRIYVIYYCNKVLVATISAFDT